MQNCVRHPWGVGTSTDDWHRGEAVLCKAPSSGPVLLSECLLVPLPAVTALALKDNNYSKHSTIISKSRGRIGFHCLTPWFGMEALTDCEFIPKD